MMTRNRFTLRAVAAICTLLATACGSSGGPNTNLKSVFFRTVTAAPVATLNMKRADGTAMGTSRVRIDERGTFDSWKKVGPTVTANANASGVATVVLPAGSYPIVVDPRISQNTALVGTLNDTLAISANVTATWQTSKQSWTVTSPTGKPFRAVAVEIFQVDAGGAALYAADTLNPLNAVLSANPAVAGGSQQSITFTTELFKGSYRALITATPVATTDSIAPFETAVFSAAGGGATETQAIQLASGGNVVSLKFMEGAAVMLDSQIGNVLVFDAGSLILLNQGTSTNGVATISTGAVANVIAIVSGPGGETMAAASYTASPTHTATLTRYTVSGHVKAPAALVQPYGSVAATVKPGLGAFWDAQIAGSPVVTTTIADAQGTYVLPLISGSWSLQAMTLTNLANSAALSLSVNNANLTAQDISVNAGGVITGNIQDQSKVNIPGVQVAVYTQDSSHTFVGTATTDAGGNYSIPVVPFGTYEVFADGAVTQGVAVSSSAATKTLNLTRFAITGRLTDLSLAAVLGNVTWAGAGSPVTAGALGTFNINVMQGLNWFLFAPPAGSSLGFAYELNALVNADTIKSLQ
jgi:hypothetical protein